MPQVRRKAKPAQNLPAAACATVPKASRSRSYMPEDLQKAVEACKSSNPARISLQKAEEQFGVPKSTISDALRGKLPRTKAHESQQLLNCEEEAILAQLCKIRGYRGDPVGQDELRDLAAKICGTKPNVKWVYAFAGRNPGMSFKWAQRGESKRGNGLTKAAVASFFQDLKECTKDVTPENTWNCDEKGFQANGGLLRRRVLVAQDQKDVKIMGDESRKMVTILKCVSAAGGSISPFIIHEGAAIDLEWIRCNPCGAEYVSTYFIMIVAYQRSIAASPNGWTDSDAALRWLSDVFEPQTRPDTEGAKRLLILDGYVSHCTLEFVTCARNHQIIILCLPPHCTHRRQPLDVGVFGPLSKAWSRFVKESQESGYFVTKNTFLSIYSKARSEALVEKTIKSAFKRCGIHPLDESKITEEDTAPAENTSCLSSQPIPAFLPSYLMLEVISNREENEQDLQIISSPNSPTQNLPHPRPALATIPENIPRTQYVNLPKRPPKYASHKDKDAAIDKLFDTLDENATVIKGYHARLVVADDENGRLRAKIYGRKSKRLQVTRPSPATGRILTADKQFDELYRQDRKRAMKEVLKQMKPILNQISKTLTDAERKWAKEDDNHEKMEIKIAKGEMERAEKETAKLTRQIELAQSGLEKAEERRDHARTESAANRENKACSSWKQKLSGHLTCQASASQRFSVAQAAYNVLVAKRKDRLEKLADMEKQYEAAIAADKRAKEIEDERRLQEKARRAKLPQRPKDAASLWRDCFSALQIHRPPTKHDQEDVRLQFDTQPALHDNCFEVAHTLYPLGLLSDTESVPNGVEDDENIDPVLREFDFYGAASAQRRNQPQDGR
ncbi:related to transposase [Serendipita indica DSM 11827]|uniref:Related to transposase n=1 Tax=Serendipita indica (strain DSM 11827) TaxID=1109443 RepID=G4TT42_SERID|nr:related to transposase [Serendipita indica DSM 11827]